MRDTLKDGSLQANMNSDNEDMKGFYGAAARSILRSFCGKHPVRFFEACASISLKELYRIVRLVLQKRGLENVWRNQDTGPDLHCSAG